MLFFWYSGCSTCKRAKKFLDEVGATYEIRDLKSENPSYEELKTLYEKSSLDIKKFFNTSGMLYKSMNLKDKLADMSLEDKLRLLASDGMLVKRPILVANDDTVLVGFKQEAYKEVL